MMKVTIVNFPEKMLLDNMSKNYAALCFVIHFDDFFKTLL